MRLLERAQPLEVLCRHARGAAEGRGAVVLVAGEAGVGKTVLLRAFAAEAAAPVLWGLCDALSTPRPLGPLRDVADELGVGVARALREATAQHEIFSAVLAELRGGPRALVVEDLHWGDEATLDLVRFLGRRISTLPLLLVLSYREPLGATDPLRSVLGDLGSGPDTERLQLAPLSRKAVAELIGGRRLDPAHVHARTAGNPFYVSQILAQPDSPLPGSVRDAVIARTAGLSPPDRRALELLSCAPDGVSGELLAVLFMPHATVEALGATGLLDRHGQGVTFRHEIARLAVLEGIPPGAEPALHATLIDALETIGADASVLAHHASAAADVPRVIRYARTAAEEAARSGAHREAVAFYRHVLRHRGDDADLLEALAEELYLTDRLGDAIGARTRALELRRESGDVAGVGAGHCALSRFERYAANRPEAERHDEAAIALLRDADEPRTMGYALVNRSYLAASYGYQAMGLRAAQDALRIADRLDDAALRSAAMVGDALARLPAGDPAARSDLLAARDQGIRLRVDDLVTVPMSNLANADVEHGRFAQADAVLADALRLSEERGVLICHMWQQGIRARLRLLQGRWAEAEQDALAVLAAGHLPLGRLWAHFVLGLLAARREAPADNPHLDELWQIGTNIGVAGKLTPAVAALAEQAWITRRPDPRLGDPSARAVRDTPGVSGDQQRQWLWRLAVEGIQDVGGTGPERSRADHLPYEQAMTQWDNGSVPQLLAALPGLDGLDARAVATRVRGRLRELGVPSSPRGPAQTTRTNPAGLTDRQLDVLGLLVEGMSNADVAARLVISPKTADHHVSAILAKLQVRSRGEAVAAARRLGLDVVKPPAARAAPEAP
ncbi:AAA family ATPase [Actinoplanes sp. LDG1-06]|uniref:AAA family ATPase n=1 Tax=Paractinoplanes ovalisporus TaxID=2810368 RepID=A0ABS2AQJ9_9ACTN|nr:LuxR family transcriptional regulator [Actinoplanes ovalisporus]MBM2622060.1 AAA family ATPase [Actinoplanes ovalisporus]